MESLITQYLAEHGFKDVDDIQFSPVPKGQEGDRAMSFFILSKSLKKSPVQIAQEVAKILETCDLIERTVMAGPYLNLFFSNEAFFASALNIKIKGESLLNKNIVLEFSGPNTNKPLHLGHMRNHALGISVSNLLEAAGAEIHRVNIINDRGVHICKSMLAYQKFGNGETPESTGEKGDGFVGRYYVKFDQASKEDPSLNDEVQVMLQAWEAGDQKVKTLWEKMNTWTLSGHQETYARQGVIFEQNYKESNYYLEGKNIARKGLDNKVFQTREDGAVVINFEDEHLGQKVILRPDGTSIYLTQDLAVAVARDKDFNHPDELIYVVGDEQKYHFEVLFGCLDRLGTMQSEKCYHLSYGMVNLPEGRMKSREGTVVDADPMMDELNALASAKLKENNPDMSESDIYQVAEQIQNAAWKFYLLKTTPTKSIMFEAAKAIDFQGATGPYLQYAGVRIKSILTKAGTADTSNMAFSEAEKTLGVKIMEWPDTLSRAAEAKNPTYIVTYLLELAQTWSSFYAENSVVKAESEALKNGRLALAAKILTILEAGLGILGIEIPERM